MSDRSQPLLARALEAAANAGVGIPEQDYRKLATLDACVDYVAAALAPR